ncbi:LysM peptidoglycan-binding domain-containing protein [Psychroserpens burtonensis]|uniref:LysM peptidoglycan-binding domain-containing protein n=2 Tax=Psychroserpens burtonensis TaxID=49278 RepID=A0A5C7B681_9FLAO|nr:LysM peptidoglycan-binding domain-containing protein [Psychroserpens burtonensis]
MNTSYKSNRMARVFFKFLAIFSFCFFYGNAQNPTKNHTVTKGETVYRLSKIYEVSISDIIKLNPSASKVIYVGEVLKIPVSSTNSGVPKNSDKQDFTTVDNVLVYKVKSGDTKFGLTKKIGITITDLENQNPHIKKGLQAGHVLKISNSNYSSPSTSKIRANPQQSESYKWHDVIKGDTFYSISKLYTVDLASLITTNSSIIPEKMSIGIRVKIPNKLLDSDTSIQDKTEYLVKKGDTKFGLAKTFNTTIANLEKLNPQILDMLRYGVTIKTPSKTSNTLDKSNISQVSGDDEASIENTNNKTSDNEETKTLKNEINEVLKTDKNSANSSVEDNDSELAKKTNIEDSSSIKTVLNKEKSEIEKLSYTSYTIAPKETLYGLSKKASMSVPEFLKLNPKLSESVIIGTVIKMPITGFNAPLNNNSKNTNANNTRDSYTDLSTLITSRKDKKILMLMQFNDIEFNYYTRSISSYNAISNTALQNDIQFYKGAKTAIDSLVKMGIKTEINLLKVDDIKRTKALENIDLKSFDAIITLDFNKEIENALVSKANNNIPIIIGKSESENYKINTVYQALPSASTQKLKTLKYINNKNGNIIVISDNDRLESRSFISEHSPGAKVFVTNKNGEFSDKDVISNLDKSKTNYIIIDSKKNGVFLSSTTLLLGLLSNYDIQLAVLESNLLPNDQEISSKRFSILKLIYPDIYQITNTAETLNYFNNYKLKNNIDPSKKALQGFDIIFDTMLRLSQDMDFEESLSTFKTEYLILKFYYKKNTFGNYDNHEIIIREFNNSDIAN